MHVTVIYPSDYIGCPEVIFTYETISDTAFNAASEVIAALEDVSPGNMPETIRVRQITAGDLLIVGDQLFMVEIHGHRPISSAFANSWRKRTLVERLIGSGEYARVCGKKSEEHVAVQ